MIIHSTSFRFLLCSCAVVALAGCGLDKTFGELEQRGDQPVEEGSSEDLLAAEGSWNIVEEDAASADPTSLHRLARKRVDPASMKKKTFMPESELAMAENGAEAAGQDVNYRLLRVERNVASLRQDFKKLLPPLSRLIVADKNLDQTIESIQSRDDSVEPAAGITPKMKRPPPKKRTMADVVAAQKKPAAPVSASAGSRAVKSLRLGEHPGKTRIVLDITGPATFRSDVDNNEKLLLVELPGTGWNAAGSKSLKHPLIAGYTAQPGPDGGTMLAIEMKKPFRVTGGSTLPPNPTYNNHRVFVDVSAL